MSHPHKVKLLICLILWIVEFALYLPSLQSDFVNFDDTKVLLAHPSLYNEHSLTSSLKEILFNYFPREEPLIIRDITWALDSYVYGFKNPFGYHFGNVLLNSCNVVLLFIFLMSMGNRLLDSLLIAITFGALPVHVEAVSWVMGRKDMLVTFFMLLALIAQTAYLNSTDERKQRILYLITVLMTLSALLSKISAFTFFLVLGAHQIYYPIIKSNYSSGDLFGVTRALKKVVFRLAPHFFMTLFVFIWYKQIITTWGVLDRGIDSLSWTHISNLAKFTPIIIALYVKFIVYPFQYSASYLWPSIYEPFTSFHMVISGIAALAILMISIFLFFKRKDLFFYWLIFFLLLIPYLNFIYSGIWIANRYIYFSSFCILSIAAGLLIDTVLKQKKWIQIAAWLCWAGFILLNIFQTYYYQRVWRDDLSLAVYENELENPSIASYAFVANAYLIRGENEKDAESKAKLLKLAEVSIQKGLSKVNNPEVQYIHPDMFRLYYLQSLLSGVREEPLQEQIKAMLHAYEIMPQIPNLPKKISKLYYLMALESVESSDKTKFAEHSLIFFNNYIALVNDPLVHKTNLLILNNEYEKNFPFLKDKITETRKRIFEKLK